MARFSSPTSYGKFRSEVIERTRFVRSRSANRFLNAVAHTMTGRVVTLRRDDGLFFRAQKHIEWSDPLDNNPSHVFPVPATAERMKPPKNRAPDGRANPRGISFLYMSNNPETAMSELRPWMGSMITVASLQLVRDVRLVDCSRFHGKGGGYVMWLATKPPKDWNVKPSLEEIEDIVWGEIDNEFSTPVDYRDDSSVYVPTQILAELFRSKGLDGIIYKSRLTKDGHNLQCLILTLLKW